jgi:endoglucanase
MKLILALVTSVCAFAANPTLDIKVDQAGYPAGAPKVAVVVAGSPASAFIVRRSKDGSAAFRGKLSKPAADADSGDRVQAADFTRLDAGGRYYLEVPGVGRSWDFDIGPHVYARVYYLAMRSFYGQRCGTAVDLGPEFPGYKHAACHLTGAYHPSSGKTGPRASYRGWHDAGDYGRYVVNSGITTGTLLWTWEMFGPRIRDVRLNIPESGNGTPDILNEIRWNLDWMLSMQDDDGGVWPKQTLEAFGGFVMPEKEQGPSYVIGSGKAPYKNSCATADLAAAAAIAARTFRPFDAAYAATNLAAARKAWTWLEKYPNVTFEQNPPGIRTGTYGDKDCGDELLWASAELWRTTREDRYQRYFLTHYGEYLGTLAPGHRPPEWSSVGPLGLWTYVLGGGKDAQAVAAIRRRSVVAADDIAARAARNGYRIALLPTDYVWGSNGMAANYAMQLVVANVLAPHPRYVRGALDTLHYLLGRNTFSLSWVTQVGENPCRHIHHRPSGAMGDAEPWPGLLAGGPDADREDAVMKALPAGLPRAKFYKDTLASYSSNEIAINWNAPLVFVLTGVMADRPAAGKGTD